MSHLFKIGTAVYTTGGSVIKVKDTITVSKNNINIGFNYPQCIDFDTVSKRYWVASNNTIKCFDINFTVIDSVTSIGGICSIQLDLSNNRLIVTDKNNKQFWSINLTTRAVTSIFTTAISEAVRFGHYDAELNVFYMSSANTVYVYDAGGVQTGTMSDSRVTNIIGTFVNYATGYLMICSGAAIYLGDRSSLLIQAGSISGAGVTTPNFITFDRVSTNSYWLCNGGAGTISEMTIGANSLVRTISIPDSIIYSVWVEAKIGLYSLFVPDASYNQFYNLRERLV